MLYDTLFCCINGRKTEFMPITTQLFRRFARFITNSNAAFRFKEQTTLFNPCF
nr:MAG TPA: hypothetical protein [Caudoviricetes sp.]